MVFRDLFATEYLADPDNAENTKAIDILKAWNVLLKDEKNVRQPFYTHFTGLIIL